jgi:hypothetical protein
MPVGAGTGEAQRCNVRCPALKIGKEEASQSRSHMHSSGGRFGPARRQHCPAAIGQLIHL